MTPEFIFKRALLGDIDSDDFVAGKIPVVVTDTATAQPGFQSRAVFALPIYFDIPHTHLLLGSALPSPLRADLQHHLRGLFDPQ